MAGEAHTLTIIVSDLFTVEQSSTTIQGMGMGLDTLLLCTTMAGFGSRKVPKRRWVRSRSRAQRSFKRTPFSTRKRDAQRSTSKRVQLGTAARVKKSSRISGIAVQQSIITALTGEAHTLTIIV